MADDFPSHLDNCFDGELASELFLHLDATEIKQILDKAKLNLKPGGRFIFTFYPLGYPDSLDRKFSELGLMAGMDPEDFIENRVIGIGTLAQQLKRKKSEAYQDPKNKYWLDLEQVRVFSVSDIEKLCLDSGFQIKNRYNLNGGMFSFAYRSVYVLTK